MFFQTALLAAALVMLDLLLGHRLRSALRYGLWLLLVVKLLLPPSLLLPTGAGYWLGPWFARPVVVQPPARYQVTAEAVDPTLEIAWNPPVVTPAAPHASLSLHAKLLLAWAAGALLLALGMMVRNRPIGRLARSAGDASADLQALLREAAASVGLRRVPALRISEANHSPALCGFLQPAILLPRALAGRLSRDGLRAVLLHELTHLRRQDLWVNLLQALVQVLWWWNPLVWLANARIRTLREQAVDEGVMFATQQDRAAYPATLVEVARHCAARPMIALSFLGIFESRRALRSRVDRLLHAPLPQRAGLGWSGWITLLVTAFVALPMAFNRRVEATPANEPTVITRLNWRPWSEAAVTEARAAGRPVVVDFTAKWCVDCQVNRRTLESAEVLQELQAINALVLEADFTQSNALIAAKLAELGQPGVPLVLLYPADPAEPPETYTVLASSALTASLTAASAPAAFSGLAPGTTTPASPGPTYPMDPLLARRYGLVPANPTASAPDQGRVVTVTVPAEDTGFDLDGRTVSAEELHAALAERMAPDANLVLRLIANPKVPMSRIVFAMDAAKAAGITRFSLSTASPDDAGRVPLTVDDGRMSAEPVPLLTRQFRVNPNTFIQALELVTGAPPSELTGINQARHKQGQLREFFRAAGVDFSAPPEGGTPDQNRKVMYFNDRAGVLFVRATAEDLEIIEKAIQVLNAAPPQVQVEVKFVEIEDRDSQALGLDWFLGNAPATPIPGTTDAGPVRGGAPGGGPGGVFPQAGGTSPAPAIAAPSLTGILTGQQFRTVLAALESRPGVTLLSAPRVTTLSARQAQISMVNLQSVVDADGTTNAVPFGPVLDVIPYVTADGQAIQLTVIAGFTELLATDPATPHLPRLRSSQLMSSATVRDSQTLVLAADILESTASLTTNQVPTLGDLPRIGRLFRSEARPTRKRLLVFVTPTIIDPAGQRVNAPASGQ